MPHDLQLLLEKAAARNFFQYFITAFEEFRMNIRNYNNVRMRNDIKKIRCGIVTFNSSFTRQCINNER